MLMQDFLTDGAAERRGLVLGEAVNRGLRQSSHIPVAIHQQDGLFVVFHGGPRRIRLVSLSLATAFPLRHAAQIDASCEFVLAAL